MSIDILDLFTAAVIVAGVAICILAAVRGWQIRRVQVNQVYRRRAAWNVFVSVFALAIILLGSPWANTVPTLLDLYLASFALLPLVTFAFVDSMILAAMEIDFFHRNTLGWRQLRLPFFLVELTFLFVALAVYFIYFQRPPFQFGILAVAVAVVGISVISYSVVTLFTASRRTEDRTLKKHTRLLGFLIVLVAILLADALLLPSILVGYSLLPVALLGVFLTVAAPYTIYLMVMSLSQRGTFEESVIKSVG